MGVKCVNDKFFLKAEGRSLLTEKANLGALSTLYANHETCLLPACRSGSAATAIALKFHVKKARI